MKKSFEKNYPIWWSEACIILSKRDKVMKSLIEKYNNGKITTFKNPFYSLSKCIVGQQISVQAADAVWGRLSKKFNLLDEKCFCDLKPEFLKSFGLSLRKTNYLIILSNYMVNKNSFDFWVNLNDKEIYTELITLKGIGPWSIKMFLIFCLNRKDIFSSEDLGLMKAIGTNYFRGSIPSKDEAEDLALKWSPWRTVASWYLWRSIDPDLVVY
mgnify:CR=1 FL=1